MKINELYVELTRNCNLHCAHCFYGEAQNAVMNEKTLQQVFQEFKHVDCLVAGGGEPFLNFAGIKQIAGKIIREKINVDTFFIATNGCVENIDGDEVIRLLSELQRFNKTELILKLSNTPYHCKARSEKENVIYQSFKSKLEENKISFFEFFEDEEFINEGNAKANKIIATEKQFEVIKDENFTKKAIEDKILKITCEGDIIAGCCHSYANAEKYKILSLKDYLRNGGLLTSDKIERKITPDMHKLNITDRNGKMITVTDLTTSQWGILNKGYLRKTIVGNENEFWVTANQYEHCILKQEKEREEIKQAEIRKQEENSANKLFFENMQLLWQNREYIFENEKYYNILPLYYNRLCLGLLLKRWENSPEKCFRTCKCGGRIGIYKVHFGSPCSGCGAASFGVCMDCMKEYTWNDRVRELAGNPFKQPLKQDNKDVELLRELIEELKMKRERRIFGY
jgi:hypothetical protein